MGDIPESGERPDSSDKTSSRYTSDYHFVEAFEKMRNFLLTDQFTDVVLKVGDTVIKAHRLVLASASEYFLTMFTSDLIESKAKEVEMYEVDEHALRQLVSFAYSGQIEITEDTVESVLATAVLLRFTEIIEACTNFILKHLDTSNCIGVAVFAESRNCSRLHNAAFSYTVEHIVEVMENEEYLFLTEEDLIRILSSDNLNVPTETAVYRGVMKWVNYDVGRKNCLKRLLSCVKLPLLPPDVLIDEVIPQIGQASVDFFVEALSLYLFPEQSHRFRAASVTPRKSTVGKLYFVTGCQRVEGSNLANCCSTVTEYSPLQDKWTLIARKSSRRQQLGVATLGQRLFMIGGRDGFRSLESAEMLDLESKMWIDITPMLTARHSMGVAILDSLGPIFAVGGHDGWSFLNTVERWDAGTGEWTYSKPMDSPRSTAGAAFLNNRLYVVGGRNGVACLDTLDAYDPLCGKWNSCAAMPNRRGGIAAVVLVGQLYAIGGYDSPTTDTASRYSSVERYDPRNDSWQPAAGMSVARDGVGAAVMGNKIYAVGGFEGQNYVETVEEYDPFTDTWAQVTPLNFPGMGACGVFKK